MKLKFVNLSFEPIPSKTQIIGRESSRIAYFKKLIKEIQDYASNYGGTGEKSSIKVKLLKVLYNLLMIDATPVK